jgi:ParB family chromosome partitioning protein
MPKSSRDSLNAKGKRDAYMFDPDDLVLVTDEASPLYDERIDLPIDEALVLNIMFVPAGGGAPQGVLEPINAMRNTETGKVEVIDGRQRVKAAREANKRLRKAGLEPVWVPAMLKKTTGHGAMGMLISSNEHRQNDTPLGRAKKMQRYIDLGRDEAEISVLFGISQASVKNQLSLLDAPAAVRNAVEAGKISTSDGYKLAKLEPAEAKEKVAELVEHAPRTPGKKRSKNAKKAREIVSNGKQPKISKKAEDAVATDIAAWIDTNYEDALITEIIKAIRAGKWRAARGEKDA